ncbi:MAG: VTT domain-containing protein [Phycisphaerae bacterium]|nr:VTT domain-containing protein [Phycisphaerae bacterium]
MERLSTATITHRPGIFEPHLPDNVSVRRWFTFYGLILVTAAALLAVLITEQGWSWQSWRDSTAETFTKASPAIKLIGFGIYMSLCCTFLPLPTGWIVAAVATREAAISGNLWGTVLGVAAVGAIGSTVANLNDYHLLTWFLRHHKVARVRQTKTYRVGAAWFARSPFFILVVFNLIPIPIDIIRMLATTYRYPRAPFTMANFVGRLMRYGIIAFVTYWWNLGWYAVVALLALAVVLGAGRVLPAAFRRLRSSRPDKPLKNLSDSVETRQELQA